MGHNNGVYWGEQNLSTDLTIVNFGANRQTCCRKIGTVALPRIKTVVDVLLPSIPPAVLRCANSH